MDMDDESLSQPLLSPAEADTSCTHAIYKTQDDGGIVKVCVCGQPTCTCNLSNSLITPAMMKWNPTFTFPIMQSSGGENDLAERVLFSSSEVSGVKIGSKSVEILAPNSSSSAGLRRSIASLLQSLGLLDESFYRTLPPSTMVTSQFRVTGMTCSSCVAMVENLVGNVPGVQSVSVSLLNNSLLAIHDPDIASLDLLKVPNHDLDPSIKPLLISFP